MTYDTLVPVHLATVLPAFLIGTYLMLNIKGTPQHKVLGRIYRPLMIVTGVATLLMPAAIGPRLLGHFGFIHLFSLLTLYSAPAAYIYVRRGNIRGHQRSMIGLYVGGLVIAGSFAFMPGHMLHEVIF